jgi:hypothetical protein
MPIRSMPLPLACMLALLLSAPVALASREMPCATPVLAPLGHAIKVAHFVPGPTMRDGDPAGVIVSATCKRLPDDPRLTLVAVAWNAGKEDEKSLVLALVDEATGKVVASLQDVINEDATTQIEDYSLRLDTAAYDLAPGVRAVGLDIVSENRGCGEGGFGPSRTLYVREGATFRPVLADLFMTQFWYVRGNQPRCVSDQKEAETAILEDFSVSIGIGIGATGKDGWRDLTLSATSKRSDKKPGRKPLHVHVPYDGKTYPLAAFNKAYEQWRQ